MIFVRVLAALALALVAPRFVLAQALPGIKTSKQARIDRLAENHWRLTGEVEIEDRDMRFFADVLDYFTDEHRIEASGNVVVVTRDSRIAADRAVFDTQKRTGTFYNASGTASMGEKVDKSLFGTQEPDAYFYGEVIEKLAYKKYRLTKGGFTTCVQPTPRWEVVSSRATITLEKYAVVRNAVLKVKDVPMFYMPIFYYPIKKDDRATGFLLPMYGNSTIRGTSFSNAFFWAINRSSDATFFHDWFTRTGQGFGGEYRYISEPGSQGNFKTYFLNEHEATYTNTSGTEVTTPARKSYEIRGTAVQRLPGRLRARANIDYFSDVTVQQTYYSNLYDASRRQRSFGGNVAGSWGPNSLSFTYNRSEIFYGTTDSTLNGTTPRVLYSRGATKLGVLPVYFSANADYTSILRTSRTSTTELVQGLQRLDATPTIRAPLAKLTWFSVNSSLTWRNTWWTESQTTDLQRLPDGIRRSYFDMRADVTGPTFTRIFDTPGNGYAERFKHVIEPTFGINRTTLIDNYNQIVKLDSVDYPIGGTTQMTYGLTNRLLAKLRSTRQAREFLTVSVFQTYYTDTRASQYDSSFGTSFGVRKPSNFSPVQITARTMPTDRISATVRVEYDHEKGEIATLTANGGFSTKEAVQASAGWSRRRVNDTRTDNLLNGGTNLRFKQGRWGGTYNFAYDFYQDKMLTQSITAYHHAQCCGIAFEFQKYAFPVFDPRFPVPSDRRFNLSFTLAGIGSFSNFFGALTGTGGSQRSF